MKAILIAAALCVVGVLAGCATTSESTAEHHRRVRQQWAMEMRMLAEDIDAVFLLDRTSRLTDWHTRIGE